MSVLRKKSKVIFSCSIILGSILMVACNGSNSTKGNEQKETTVNLEVGSTGEIEYEGVTFMFEITSEGAVVKDIEPKEGEKLIFPERIGEYFVTDVQCKTAYKEIKFPGITSVIKSNDVTEKISFWDSAVVETNSFKNLVALREVSLPKTMKITPASMFESCKSIEKVDIQNVEIIGGNSFECCTSLHEIVLNGQLKEVRKDAFKGCTALEIVDLSNVTRIEDSAFKDCEALEIVDLFNVTNIGDSAFENCIKIEIVDLSNVASIGDNAFSKCESLACDITFNKLQIKSLGRNVFEGCDLLIDKTITFNQEQDTSEMIYPHQYFIKKDLAGANIVVKSLNDWQQNVVNANELFRIAYSCDWSIESNNVIEYDRDYDGINVAQSEFVNAIKDYFDGKEIKAGEKIKLSEIKHILDMINDSGRTTYTAPLDCMEATKYRFVDSLKMAMAGVDFESQWYYDEDTKCWSWDKNDMGIAKELEYIDGAYCYSYKPLNYNMELINTSGSDIEFFVLLNTYCDDEGEEISVFNLYCVVK